MTPTKTRYGPPSPSTPPVARRQQQPATNMSSLHRYQYSSATVSRHNCQRCHHWSPFVRKSTGYLPHMSDIQKVPCSHRRTPQKLACFSSSADLPCADPVLKHGAARRPSETKSAANWENMRGSVPNLLVPVVAFLSTLLCAASRPQTFANKIAALSYVPQCHFCISNRFGCVGWGPCFCTCCTITTCTTHKE